MKVVLFRQKNFLVKLSLQICLTDHHHIQASSPLCEELCRCDNDLYLPVISYVNQNPTYRCRGAGRRLSSAGSVICVCISGSCTACNLPSRLIYLLHNILGKAQMARVHENSCHGCIVVPSFIQTLTWHTNKSCLHSAAWEVCVCTNWFICCWLQAWVMAQPCYHVRRFS